MSVVIKGKDIKIAAIAVVAKNTGRVLLQQRVLEDGDKDAEGHWELPGGRLEDGESAWDAAVREWSEEVGCDFEDLDATLLGSFTDDGYQVFVVQVSDEDDIDINERFGDEDAEPDPDTDQPQVTAWFDPADLPGMQALREELHAQLPKLLPLVGAKAKKSTGLTVAIDLDGTISAAPLQIGQIARGLSDGGWRVVVLTGTGDGTSYDEAGLEAKRLRLAAYQFDCWDQLVLFPGTPAQVAQGKADWCRANGAALFIDNSTANAQLAVEAQVPLVLVPWATRV